MSHFQETFLKCSFQENILKEHFTFLQCDLNVREGEEEGGLEL